MKIELRKDTESGSRYWLRFAEDDGSVLAHSHFHDDRSEAERAIAIIKAEAGSAYVVDLTDD